MVHFTLAAVPGIMKLVMGIWVFAAVVLIFIVLIQKGKGGGLGAAFGGVGSSLLGTKTGDFLTWVTICFVAAWLLLSVVAAKWFKPASSEYIQSQQRPAAPVSIPAPTVPVGTTQLPQVPQQAESQQSDIPGVTE